MSPFKEESLNDLGGLSWEERLFKLPRHLDNLDSARGIQVNVRDSKNTSILVGNPKYRVSSDHSKVIWFRPSDFMPTNATTQFQVDDYADKFEHRIMASEYLPKCIRET